MDASGICGNARLHLRAADPASPIRRSVRTAISIAFFCPTSAASRVLSRRFHASPEDARCPRETVRGFPFKIISLFVKALENQTDRSI